MTRAVGKIFSRKTDETSDAKKYWADRFILRELFWDLVLPYNFMREIERQSRSLLRA